MAPRHLYLTISASDRSGNLKLQAYFVAGVLLTAAYGLAIALPTSPVEAAQQPVHTAVFAIDR